MAEDIKQLHELEIAQPYLDALISEYQREFNEAQNLKSYVSVLLSAENINGETFKNTIQNHGLNIHLKSVVDTLDKLNEKEKNAAFFLEDLFKDSIFDGYYLNPIKDNKNFTKDNLADMKNLTETYEKDLIPKYEKINATLNSLKTALVGFVGGEDVVKNVFKTIEEGK